MRVSCWGLSNQLWLWSNMDTMHTDANQSNKMMLCMACMNIICYGLH